VFRWGSADEMKHSLALLFVSLFVVSLVSAQQPYWVFDTPIPTNRSDHTVVNLGGNVVVAGGCSGPQFCQTNVSTCFCTAITNTVEAYDPIANTWKALPNLPIPMYRHTCVAVQTSMYCVGGRDINDIINTQAFVMSPTTGGNYVWSNLPNWNAATSDTVGFALNNTVYILSGYEQDYTSVGTVWTFTPAPYGSGQWETGSIPPLNQDRGDACCAVADGKAFVVGGYTSDIGFCTPLKVLEIYDPIANSWTYGSPMEYGRGDAACAELHELFHVIGGETKDANCSLLSVPVNHVEYYNITNGVWTEETPLPGFRFRFSGTSIDDHVYAVGGQGPFYPITDGNFENNLLNDNLEYIDTFGSLTTGPPPTSTSTSTSTSTTSSSSRIFFNVFLAIVSAAFILV